MNIATTSAPKTDHIAGLDPKTFFEAYENVLGIKLARRSAIASICFGLIGCGVAAGSLSDEPMNIVLLMISIYLLATGTLALAIPKHVYRILEALGLLLVAAWNLYIVGANNADGRWLFLGILQIIAFFDCIKIYWKLKESIISQQQLAKVQQFLRDMIASSPSEQRDSITIFSHANARTNKERIWKGVFVGGHAVMVRANGANLLIMERSEVSIKAKGKLNVFRTPLAKLLHLSKRDSDQGETLSCEVSFGRDSFKAHLTERSFQNFTNWKTS